MANLSFSLFIIFTGLTSGYLVRQLSLQGIVKLPFSITSLAKTARNLGIIFFIPLAFLLAIWVTEFSDSRLFTLPFIGVATLAMGGLFGYLLGLYKKYSHEHRAVLFCTTSFTNIGAVGSLVCYLFLGEAGFALVTFYRLFEELYYFLIGYPATQMIANAQQQKSDSILLKLIRIFKQPFLIAIITALSVGLTLNFTGVDRPDTFAQFNNYLIPIGTFVLLFSVGLGLRFSSIREHLGISLHVAVIRATLVPLFSVVLAWSLGLGEVQNGLPLAVVFILASMPPAVNAIVATSVYDLDIDLANSAWVVSTLSMIVVLPWIYGVLHLLII